MMNIFRFAGDMLHLASILILLLKILATKSAAGMFLEGEGARLSDCSLFWHGAFPLKGEIFGT